MRASKILTCTVLMVGLCGFTMPSAFGKDRGGLSNPGVLPPWSNSFGDSYDAWTAQWWQWALAQPLDTNPIEDPDGSFQSADQAGKVWFLAGTSGFAAERYVTLPTGKAIFFPILNSIWVTLEAYGDPPFSEPGAEEAARAAIEMDPVADLEVVIDGKPLHNLLAHRVLSPVFPVYMPETNWFDQWIPVDGGIYPDCVADGYWVMLAPLSRGEHTLYIRGTDTRNGWTVEVIYYLTVEK